MDVIRIGDISKNKNHFLESVACIGFFDGLHKGHQQLIAETIMRAHKNKMKPAMITFDPDPWSIIHSSSTVNHITPMFEKMRLAEFYGIEALYVIEFNADISKLTADEFVNHFIKNLNVKELVCGSDFRFGFKGMGTPLYLQENFSNVVTVNIVDLLYNNLEKISTTHIVQSILSGDMESVSNSLNRNYCMSGTVIHGRKQGRKIGFPTANLDISREYVLPKPGIYAGYVLVREKMYRSIVNLGYNPTFNTTDFLSIETHILDFDSEIYGETITQSFAVRIREEMKFDSIDSLVQQMKLDELFAREYLTLDSDEIMF